MNVSYDKLPYWDRLTDNEKNMIKDSAVVKNYSDGSTIYGGSNAGFSCLGMIYIISGELRAYILSEEGREITLFKLDDGDSCVLSASCVISQIDFDTILTVEKEASILVVPTSVFGKLINENIYVRCYMYELSTERFSAVMRIMQTMLFNHFDKRLASFLLSEYRRTGSTSIHLTQETIARNVNSAREVVARMLRKFSEKGYIETQRAVIIIKDIQGLENIL